MAGADHTEAGVDGDRILFIQVSQDDHWTGEEVDNLVEVIADATPPDVRPVVTLDSIEYLDVEQTDEYVSDLIGALTDEV